MRHLLYSLLLLCLISGKTAYSQTRTAGDIIRQTLTTYQHCKTYTDQGVIVIRYKTSKGSSSQRIHVKTQFRRSPGQLTYQSQWVNTGGVADCFAVVSENNLIRSFARLTANQQIYLSKQDAITRANEFSGGAAFSILSLLYNLPTDIHWNIGRVSDWVVKEPLQLKGRDFYQLKGSLPDLNISGITVLIDPQTFLIKRLMYLQKNTGDVLTVIELEPAMNQDSAVIVPVTEDNYCLPNR
ncbi:hypothetical protein [Arsenicibacter rosenii]|uniref:Outer membrane lipoprotein-sorting protein n=1 Tax=Arsenicibacter rosenii TaxID=1750698 RepID=A0A1S2VL43_9BACT|nr:hypothetical protein [Arsenicibacter rosenii]OIN59469.1 hypothetical protein BLX24_10900 [Arsenicibacter rosenii]